MNKLLFIFAISVAVLANNVAMAEITTVTRTTTTTTTTTTNVPVNAILQDNIATIKTAIANYKAGNNLQCISILSEYVKTHPVSAAAHYYLGNAYMRIGMTDKALTNYTKTADINTVPQLTSYSLQAIDCINNIGTGAPCVYYAFNRKQLAELQADPSGYLRSVRNNLLSEEVIEGSDPEIEKLIKGEYSDRIHPEAKQVLYEEKLKKQQYNLNKKKSMLPVSNELETANSTSYPLPSYAPNAASSSNEVTADEMELIIMSETAALNK